MIDPALRRRFFAEEIEAVAHLRTPALCEALASVRREAFLPPGPWLVRGEGQMGGARATPDAHPRHVYHNCSIAIDAGSQLFNGAPSVVAALIDALSLEAGQSVLHIGAGLGYYSAVMAETVGPSGRVTAVEVDEALAAQAKANLARMPCVEVVHGNGTQPLSQPFDAILVNAGVTHPLDGWLDALAPGARLVLPLTATMPAMGATLGKGLTILITRSLDGLSARPISFVSVYSAVDVRDAQLNQRVGQALMRNPFPPLKRLRRDPHEPGPSCWMHGSTSCFALD
jgi:protein-L-isoaspartate(D-aspartate) O-methyltransferase